MKKESNAMVITIMRIYKANLSCAMKIWNSIGANIQDNFEN